MSCNRGCPTELMHTPITWAVQGLALHGGPILLFGNVIWVSQLKDPNCLCTSVLP